MKTVGCGGSAKSGVSRQGTFPFHCLSVAKNTRSTFVSARSYPNLSLSMAHNQVHSSHPRKPRFQGLKAKCQKCHMRVSLVSIGGVVYYECHVLYDVHVLVVSIPDTAGARSQFCGICSRVPPERYSVPCLDRGEMPLNALSTDDGEGEREGR